MKPLACLLLPALIAGCAARSIPDSVHCYRDSAELKAVYIETYRAAAAAARELSKGLPAGSWGVILDVDETILDNSDYEKALALSGKPYKDATWNAWVEQRSATALPGAKEFIDTVRDELHAQVILVTNRRQQQCAATEENLRARQIQYDRILCDSKGDGDKNPRFKAVIEGTPGGAPPLNVLVWVGDIIQDFPSLQQSTNDASRIGSRYFVLPNPMYGSWSTNPYR
jgi:5'-nucleotidase (lipoprotein e(P4) family)